ncbi:MAG: hypothetical protein QNJ14_15485 [Woeseiaceae bacterium]|nr:hypothetical protein [Woeseiaceae bacterium]
MSIVLRGSKSPIRDGLFDLDGVFLNCRAKNFNFFDVAAFANNKSNVCEAVTSVPKLLFRDLR